MCLGFFPVSGQLGFPCGRRVCGFAASFPLLHSLVAWSPFFCRRGPPALRGCGLVFGRVAAPDWWSVLRGWRYLKLIGFLFLFPGFFVTFALVPFRVGPRYVVRGSPVFACYSIVRFWLCPFFVLGPVSVPGTWLLWCFGASALCLLCVALFSPRLGVFCRLRLIVVFVRWLSRAVLSPSVLPLVSGRVVFSGCLCGCRSCLRRLGLCAFRPPGAAVSVAHGFSGFAFCCPCAPSYWRVAFSLGFVFWRCWFARLAVSPSTLPCVGGPCSPFSALLAACLPLGRPLFLPCRRVAGVFVPDGPVAFLPFFGLAPGRGLLPAVAVLVTRVPCALGLLLPALAGLACSFVRDWVPALPLALVPRPLLVVFDSPGTSPLGGRPGYLLPTLGSFPSPFPFAARLPLSPPPCPAVVSGSRGACLGFAAGVAPVVGAGARACCGAAAALPCAALFPPLLFPRASRSAGAGRGAASLSRRSARPALLGLYSFRCASEPVSAVLTVFRCPPVALSCFPVLRLPSGFCSALAAFFAPFRGAHRGPLQRSSPGPYVVLVGAGLRLRPACPATVGHIRSLPCRPSCPVALRSCRPLFTVARPSLAPPCPASFPAFFFATALLPSLAPCGSGSSAWLRSLPGFRSLQCRSRLR